MRTLLAGLLTGRVPAVRPPRALAARGLSALLLALPAVSPSFAPAEPGEELPDTAELERAAPLAPDAQTRGVSAGGTTLFFDPGGSGLQAGRWTMFRLLMARKRSAGRPGESLATVTIAGGNISGTRGIESLLGGRAAMYDPFLHDSGLKKAGFLAVTPSPDFTHVLVRLEVKTPSGKERQEYRLPVRGHHRDAVEPDLMEATVGETSAMIARSGAFRAGAEAVITFGIASADQNIAEAYLSAKGGDISGSTGFLSFDGSTAHLRAVFPEGLASRIEGESYQRGGSLSFVPGPDEGEVVLTVELRTGEGSKEQSWRFPVLGSRP